MILIVCTLPGFQGPRAAVSPTFRESKFAVFRSFPFGSDQLPEVRKSVKTSIVASEASRNFGDGGDVAWILVHQDKPGGACVVIEAHPAQIRLFVSRILSEAMKEVGHYLFECLRFQENSISKKLLPPTFFLEGGADFICDLSSLHFPRKRTAR